MKSFIFSLFLLTLGNLFAQNAGAYKIIGMAIDKASGTPVRGVNVSVEGTFYGTVSDIDGKFKISTSAPPPYTLVFERSPYATVKLIIKEKFDDLKIELSNKNNGGVAVAPSAETAMAEEYAVKLALIEKVLSEITWPQSSESNFTIGVLGYNPFGDNIFALEGKKIKDQPVKIIFGKTIEELQGADLLFVATTKANKKLFAELLPALQALPMLTVADEKGQLEGEAMLSFSKPNGSLALHLNEKAAKVAGISFSARLKAMAQ